MYRTCEEGQKNKPQSLTKGTELSAVPPSLTYVKHKPTRYR